MYSMTLEGLMNLANSQYTREDGEYLIVAVQAYDSAPEFIINPKENFNEKLSYYREAYSNDLTLKSNPHIKIIDYDIVGSLNDYFEG